MTEVGDSAEWTAEAVLAHVQRAIQLELFTIPAYLCAYWSIVETRSAAAERAADAISGVVNQEMMHLEQMCNLASALGGVPQLTGAAAPRYPGRVPYNRHDLEIALGPATDARIEAFMSLELPVWLDPYDLPALPPRDAYETIGDFYRSLRRGLNEVYGSGGAPWPVAASPLAYDNFRDDGFAIVDLESALRALDLVVIQGEGASKDDPHTDDPQELGHYYRLRAIKGTLAKEDLRPMITNTAALRWSSRCEKVLELFDACYTDLLQRLEASFRGEEKIGTAVGLMYAVIQPLGLYVAEVPYRASDTSPPDGHTLTPRFRLTRTTPQQAYDALDGEDRASAAVQAVAAALRLT
jgi:hypothetical protein